MTPSQLRAAVEASGSVLYFKPSTMRQFGDTMANYGVRGPLTVDTHTRKGVKVWELFRRRPVNGGLATSVYFECETFQRVHVVTEAAGQ